MYSSVAKTYTNSKIALTSKCITIICVLMAMNINQSWCLNIKIRNETNLVPVTDNEGNILPDFTTDYIGISCYMPTLFIYNDLIHQDYMIQVQGAQIQSVMGKYLSIKYEKECPGCPAVINNGCSYPGKNQMNWIIVSLATQPKLQFQYLVKCAPNLFYKPFQWGLFILLCLCTITITTASMYSRAWSYKGFGINITKLFIIIFNCIVILASVLAYYFPNFTSILLKIIGSGIGTIGVTICMSQALWLKKSRRLNQARFGFIRLLDIISFIFGLITIAIYWVTNGMWIVNDILAICTIVAGIKILKVRSLNDGMFMLYTMLIIEIVLGLIIHYGLKMSYNNLVIQMFESPLVVAFPSITPQFYRKCAWIPITNILFPGLLISFLRRFDKSRGTFMYLIIGYLSFYIGSILWMVIDMNTIHSLPLAIVSDPITTIAVLIFSHRRNQLKTIWSGRFFDSQMPDINEQVFSNGAAADSYIAFSQFTENLKIDRQSVNSIAHNIKNNDNTS